MTGYTFQVYLEVNFANLYAGPFLKFFVGLIGELFYCTLVRRLIISGVGFRLMYFRIPSLEIIN
jgi:hypothetical protein